MHEIIERLQKHLEPNPSLSELAREEERGGEEDKQKTQTKSNEWVVSGYFVNVLEVLEALSRRRWTKCLFVWLASRLGKA